MPQSFGRGQQPAGQNSLFGVWKKKHNIFVNEIEKNQMNSMLKILTLKRSAPTHLYEAIKNIWHPSYDTPPILNI